MRGVEGGSGGGRLHSHVLHLPALVQPAPQGGELAGDALQSGLYYVGLLS